MRQIEKNIRMKGVSKEHLLCMAHALNYFEEGLFMYRKDGRYPIDNNLAER